MKTRAFFLSLAGLALLAGCSHRDEPAAVQVDRDAQGNPAVHVDGQQVDRNMQQANQNIKEAGKEIQAGAEQAGAALQRGAEKVDAKVGPVVREMMDDAGITARVKAKLVADPEISSLRIDVDTVDGRVALNGKVPSADQRAEAEKLASHTEGVKSVVNLIQVEGQAPPPPPAQ